MRSTACRPLAHSGRISKSGSSFSNWRMRVRAWVSSSTMSVRIFDSLATARLSCSGFRVEWDFYARLQPPAGNTCKFQAGIVAIEMAQARTGVGKSDAFARRRVGRLGESRPVVSDTQLQQAII